MSWTVSVKGVLEWPRGVLLLHNERDEWELPGGRLEPFDPSPEAALRRELHEEVGLDVEVGPLLTAYRYDPIPGRPVLIVAYRCHGPDPGRVRHSVEHDDVGVFSRAALAGIVLPEGYRRAIALAATHRGIDAHDR